MDEVNKQIAIVYQFYVAQSVPNGSSVPVLCLRADTDRQPMIWRWSHPSVMYPGSNSWQGSVPGTQLEKRNKLCKFRMYRISIRVQV